MANKLKHPISDADICDIISDAIKAYGGDLTLLERAVGALMVGRYIGWQGVRLVHLRSYYKYEKMLGVKFNEILPERGPLWNRLEAVRSLDKLGRFWQVVKGGLISSYDARKMMPSP